MYVCITDVFSELVDAFAHCIDPEAEAAKAPNPRYFAGTNVKVFIAVIVSARSCYFSPEVEEMKIA